MTTQILHTNLYTDFAEAALKQCISEIKHCGTRRMRNKFESTTIQREPNGEVVFKCSRDYYYLPARSFVVGKSELESRIWLARTIKWALHLNYSSIFAAENTWNRTNKTTLFTVNSDTVVTVSDIYAIYDTLIDRKNLFAKYSKEHLETVIGHEKDALATELEMTRRQEREACKEKWEKIIDDLDPESWRSAAYREISHKVEELRKTLIAEARIPLNKAKADYAKELKAIDEMASFATVTSAECNVADFPFA